jgi:hypothetical protein
MNMSYEPRDYTDEEILADWENEGCTLGARGNPKPRSSRNCRRVPRLREAHSNDDGMLENGYGGAREHGSLKYEAAIP